MSSLSIHYILMCTSMFTLRLDRGGGQQIVVSCLCFLITQPFLNIYRHAIHRIKAEYHSYLLVSMILYNSSEVKLKIVKEVENRFFNFYFSDTNFFLTIQNKCTQF